MAIPKQTEIKETCSFKLHVFFDAKEGLSYIKCIKIAFFDYYSVKNALTVY